MRLLLIRHGETVDNVAGNYAGTTDSALTNHGALQATRLGTHLATTDVKITHIFSSDLQRAAKTADAIRVAQVTESLEVKQLLLLREQDFGFYEGKSFLQRPKDGNTSGKDAYLEAHRNDPDFKDVESEESMRARVDAFIDGYLLQLIEEVPDEGTMAVVSHGMILSHLWKAILRRFHPSNVAVTSGVLAAEGGPSLEYPGRWSNTGVLDLEVKWKPGASLSIPALQKSPSPIPHSQPLELSSAADLEGQVITPSLMDATSQNNTTLVETPRPILQNMSLVVKAVNSLEHLKGLKKTRGGIGSLKHDSNQKTMDSFFKKQKIG